VDLLTPNIPNEHLNHDHLSRKREILMKVRNTELRMSDSADSDSDSETNRNTEIPLHIRDPTVVVLPESVNDITYPNLSTVFGIWNSMVGSGTLLTPF